MRVTADRPQPGTRQQGFTAIELCGVIGVIALVAGLLIAWGGYARDRARETACASNLKQIATAMHLYAADYDNHFPHSREAILVLAGVYVKNTQVFICPCDTEPRTVSAPEREPEGASEDEEASDPSQGFYGVYEPLSSMECSYFIVPGLMTDDPPATAIAGDTDARHRGRRNVVCLDGRLERQTADWVPGDGDQGSEE